MQTYLYCVPFASTMNKFGMTAAIDGDSAQSAPDCLVKREKKLSSCGAIFRLGTVALRYMQLGEVVFDLHDAHVCIICPVRDITHMRKCTRPSHT